MFLPDTAQWKGIAEWSNLSTRIFSGQHGDIVCYTKSTYGPQLSHQIQILTSKTNSPYQNQIYHVKHKFATAKAKSSQQKQIRHIKNKFVTAKTNSSHQKQISHIKIKNTD